jgi:uncharacterized membrane protein YccC
MRPVGRPLLVPLITPVMRLAVARVTGDPRGVRRLRDRGGGTAAALIALGVLIMFIPSHGSHRVHQVSGILVIAGGLCLLGWTAYLRRRIR